MRPSCREVGRQDTSKSPGGAAKVADKRQAAQEQASVHYILLIPIFIDNLQQFLLEDRGMLQRRTLAEVPVQGLTVCIS